VSSGCIRLTNDDIADLYRRAKVGSKVVVLPVGRDADSAPPPALRRTALGQRMSAIIIPR